MESTLALVKPHAFPRADEILSAITSAGFTITAKDVLSLNTTRAAAFYAAHPPPAGAGASSPPVPVADLIGALTAGPVMALVVSKAGGGVNDELASLAGPEDPATARTAAPGSLRARFGVDAAKNAVHVVAPGADAEAQVAFFFPERERELPSGAAAKEYLMGSVVPSLTKGLTELCRVAPADPLGWLSTFLGDAAREARGGDTSADAGAEAAKGAEANGEAKKDKQKIVFVLGGPGSGKGTQCARLVEDFHFDHFSAGDLLRAEVKSGSSTGVEIDRMIANGEIVPGDITISLLANAISSSTAPGILIDGFPRKLDQAGAFEKDVSDFAFVLFFDCPEEVMEERLLKRGETSGRVDDNAESIRKRFDTFVKTSMPVIEYYEAKGKVRRVDATKTPDEVYAVVKGFF